MTFQGAGIPILPHGGLNNGREPTQIRDDESPDCQNVRFRFGTVKKRDGYTRYITTAANANAVTGIAQFNKSDGTTAQVCTAGNDIFTESAGAWSSIKGVLTLTSGQNNLFQWAQLTNLLIGTNDADQIIKYNGTGNAAALGGAPPSSARAITAYKNYIILGNLVSGGTRSPEKAQWSAVNNAESWPAANVNTFLNQTGQSLMAFGKIGDELYVFHDRSIHKMTYTGDATTPFQFPVASPETGAVARNAVVSVDWAIFFPSYRGVFFFNGSDPEYIGANVEATWRTINTARLPYIVGWHNYLFNEVCFAISTGSSTTNDTVLVYDYVQKAWSVFKYGVSVNAAGQFPGTIPLNPLIGDYAGFVYKTNSAAYADDTTAITAYCTTKPQTFGDATRRRKVRRLQVLFDPEGAQDAVIDVTTAYDLTALGHRQPIPYFQGVATYGGATWGVDTWVAERQTFGYVRPVGEGRYFQAQFRNAAVNQSMTLAEAYAWIRREGPEAQGL